MGLLENRHPKVTLTQILPLITLILNFLNTPSRRQGLSEWIKKNRDSALCWLQNPTLIIKTQRWYKKNGRKQKTLITHIENKGGAE